MKIKIILFLCLLFSSLNANNFQTTSTQQDLLKAFNWHHKAAIKGHRASQYQLGLMFHYGSGVRQNIELARLWLTRASKQGHPMAQSVLYRFYSAKKPSYFPYERARYGMK